MTVESSGDAGPRCPGCDSELARADDVVRVNNRTESWEKNPDGYEFLVRYFSAAPGAVAAGEATTEDSWFPGFTWQRVFCRRCSRHVGWLFRSRAQVFYGLIAEEREPA